MLWTTNELTGNELQSIQAKNQNAPGAAGRPGGSGIEDRIENLSSGTMAKRSSRAEFLTSGSKKAFRCLRKAFTKAPILRDFDPERPIRIETDVLGYVIGGVLIRWLQINIFLIT